jgi:hypothetical protein
LIEPAKPADQAQQAAADDDGGPRTINTAETFDNHHVTATWSSYGDNDEPAEHNVPELAPRWIEKWVNNIQEGPGGCGKSYVATQNAICLAAGHPIFGEPVEQVSVRYLNYEEPKEEFDRRVFKIRRELGSDGKLLPLGDFQVLHLLDEPAAHILRVTKDGVIIITRFGRTFREMLTAQRDKGLHTFVVFDGLMDAILFEGSTRMDDGIARQVIAMLDRWCRELNCTMSSILHPSRAAERQGGGSYAPAWDTKPRVIHRYSLVTLDGQSLGNRKDIDPANIFTRRSVDKRSDGVSKYSIDLHNQNGLYRPLYVGVPSCGGEDPVDLAVDLAYKRARFGSRIKQDGTIGTDNQRLTNQHGIITAYRHRTGLKGIGREHFLGSLKTALEDRGAILYQKSNGGSRGHGAAGYYAVEDWEPTANVYEPWHGSVTTRG